MKKYTIGALFTPDFTKVLLILKTKPNWQAGKYNFPGGSIEKGESANDCVSREFLEETGVSISPEQWTYIGRIKNPSNYYVEIFTSICYNPERVESLTDEKCEWVECNNLPENIISNISWLVPFAKNIWQQGNADGLKYGVFEYSY